jgi:flagellar hook-associated protein 2
MYESGLVSGLDTASIISKLMTLAREPETQLQNKEDNDTAKTAVISTLMSKLSTLNTVVKQFGDSSLPFFSQSAATTTNSSVVSGVVTGSQPTQGNYSMVVSQVATAAIVNSGKLYTGSNVTAQGASFASSAGINATAATVDPNAALSTQSANLGTAADASGSITINGTAIAWDNTMSLNTILGNINNAGVGVTASYDATNQKISLTSNSTGSSVSEVVAQTSGNLLGVFNLTAGTATGTDAAYTATNVALNSSSVNLDRAVTSGTFTLNGVVFNVDASTDTLGTVLSRINNSSAGVTATFDYSTEKITVLQKSMGSDQKITLGAAGDSSNILYALKLSATNPPVGGAADIISGSDTKISINGGTEQSFGSTAITSLIPGVTVNVQGTGSAQLSVSGDIDTMVTSIKSFVTDYNDVMDYINTKITEDAVDSPTTAAERIQGSFKSDANFLEAKDRLTSIISSMVPGLSTSMNQMAQIGITTSSDDFGTTGKLVLTESTLRSALTNNSAGVQAMFNTASTGVIAQMGTALNSLTDSTNGAFSIESNMYTAEASDYKDRIAEIEDTMVAKEAALRLQYANLESTVNNYNSIGTELTKFSSGTSS